MTGADPTAIPLQVDPTSRRMSGVAIHGDTPFDVPYISEVAPNLWQGGCADGLLLPVQIRHLISLYPWEHYTVGHGLRSALEVAMYDSVEQTFDLIDGLAGWVNACRSDAPTLVHCQAGLNRSALVVARALVLGGVSPESAISQLRERRSSAVLCNPAFETWLLASPPGADHHHP